MCKAPPKCHFLEAFCNKFNPYQSPSCWPPWGSILSHLIIASRYPMLVGLLPRWHSGKESACQCRRPKKCEFNPWVGKIPWRRKWQPTLVFLPGKFHRQRRLAGCGAWGHKESDTNEWLNTHTQAHTYSESESEVTQSCLTLCNPMDCSLLGSSVLGIFQARRLEWIA